MARQDMPFVYKRRRGTPVKADAADALAERALLERLRSQVGELFVLHGFDITDTELDRIAAAIAADVRALGMRRVDQLVFGVDRDSGAVGRQILAFEGLGAGKRCALIDVDLAKATAVEESLRRLGKK